jgi:predicted AlkP superfamily pyrophosphatase or phosphodiesterase/glycerophosphoryl diester phosphodiesterase
MIRKLIYCAVWLLGCIVAEAQQSPWLLKFNNVTELQQFLSWSPRRYPLISAHRGGPQKGFPENAIETFENSIRYQPLVIECDIALSKDSALVMMHDDRLDRTSTSTGPIGDYTLEQLKQLKLKDDEGTVTDFKIPTLDEVLQWGKDKVIYTLDVKKGVPYSKVIEAVRRNKAESYSVIITYNTSQAAEVYQLAPDLMISASVSNKEALDRLAALGIPDNRLVAFIGTKEADSSLYSLLHSRHIQCILGTMGNLDRQATARGDKMYYDYVSRGADILSSDRPIEAGKSIQQYVRDNGLRSQHVTGMRREREGTMVDTSQQIIAGRSNSSANQKKPYVILISLDGFRYDYAEKHQAKHIQALGKQGVKAASMIPGYPSVTFPNHYSIVTGLYPAHHGLVANGFYDPAFKRSYSMGNKKDVADSSWYGGTPLWTLAEQHQLISASMFWVASEAAIKGIRPTYYYNFNDRMDIGKRIQAVKNWLSLPEDKRPHFITFYVSEVDHAGHSYGPDAPQTKAAVQYADSVVYELTQAVQSTGLPVNFVLVADHGMTAVDTLHPIALPAVIDTAKFMVQQGGTMVNLYAKHKEDIMPLYTALKKAAKDFKVYLKKDVPAQLHYGAKDDRMNRIGDILLLPTWPKVFSNRKPGNGYHGFEPLAVKEMHAIFCAWGPAFKSNLTIHSFENVHVYPLIASILGLNYTEKIDGNKKVLQPVLK